MGNAAAKNARRLSTSTGSHSKRGQWSGPGVPAPPGKPILIPGASEDSQPDIVAIRWERSSSNGGSAIIGYLVEHRRLGSPHWVRSSPNLCPFPELTLSGLEPGWRYQFRVRAQNNLGLSQPSELSDPLTVTLQRSAATAPRFDLELKDTTALENEQAEFVVHYSGTPIPKISWFKDGFEIFSSRRTRIVTENGKSTLLIHQTALNDEGEIKCTATNRAGHVSTRAKLVLEAPPRIRLPRQYEDGLLFEQDETVRLKVSVTGRPTPIVTWLHDGEIVQSNDEHLIEALESGECSIRIPAAKRKDRGEYSVRAVNKLGIDITSFLVTVTDRPSAPGKATIVMTLGRSVTLSWNEPEDDGGCKIGTYIVEYYRIGWDVWLKAATCRQTTTTLSELIEGSEYKFRVKAENPYGVSDPSAESDVIFIPDPKRGINSPPLRPDKSQSQREIHRGRSERRDNNEPTKRTRSLTREEANRGNSKDDFPAPASRSASAQRLASGAIGKPSRADSRVTFSDTVFLHLEKPLEDETPIARPRLKRDKFHRQNDEESFAQEMDISYRNISSSTIIGQPTFDDSGGSIHSSFIREKSPSPIPMIRIHQSSVDETTTFQSILPREEDVEDDEDDDAEKFRGSSEFMLVLYPNEETTKTNFLTRSASEGDAEEDDEDLVPPPMSLSLPELFSADHQIVQVLREAVSSTELLHERAMERFYRAVAVEEAEAAKKNGSSVPQKQKDSLDFVSGRVRTTRLRRRPSTGSPTQAELKAKWIRRRSSDGQASPKISRGIPASLLLPSPQIVSSDPNLPRDTSNEEEYTNKIFQTTISTSNSAGLHRWDEKSMPLIPQIEPSKTTKRPSLGSLSSVDHYRDVKTPDREIKEPIMADDYEESTDVDSQSEESDDSDDLKTLKSRLLAKPIVDEQDTYHPRGRPIAYVPSPEPDYRSSVDASLGAKSSYLPNNNIIQPKSILKKRTDDEPVPLNQFGRPIPPEKPIVERQKKPEEAIEINELPSEPPVTLRKKSLPDVSDTISGTVMSELDSDNASLLNAAEVAKNRRRPSQKPVLEKKTSVEEKEDLEARRAMIDHYGEIVKTYSASHAVYPPRNINANGRITQEDKIHSNRIDTANEVKREEEENVSMNNTEEPRSRRNSITSRGTTPAREDLRSSRRATRNESPAPRSRNVSTERKAPRSTSKTRDREPSQERPGSRSSSRTRKREASNDKELPASRSSSRTRKREVPNDKELPARSVSRTRKREVSKDRETPASRSSSRQRGEKIPKSRISSRANSKERVRSSDMRSSDSETSQRMTRRKSNSYRLERSRRSSSQASNRLDYTKRDFDGSGSGIDDRLIAEANINVRSGINYAIDLSLLIAAIYVYIFKKEIFAIPLIGLLLYRRIQEGINRWIPKWWQAQPRKP